jgi:hypothetical protein
MSKTPSFLGQVADLGDLYDATTDSFVSLSILNRESIPHVSETSLHFMAS